MQRTERTYKGEITMKKGYTDKKTGISYTLVGAAYLTNLVSTETNYEIGMWGQRHLDYIKQHRKVLYTSLLTSCKLNSYLHDIDELAQSMYDRLMELYVQKEGITEDMKNLPDLIWVKKMNIIKQQVIESVNEDVIYK